MSVNIRNNNKLRILAVGAHPDDVEICCGGTLARYALAGHHVMMGYATNGDKGHLEIPPDELALVREKESRAAAAVIGAEVYWLNFPDAELFYDAETRLAFIDMLRQARPDIIFTHWSEAYHPDHVAAGQLTFSANYISGVPHIKTQHPASDRVAKLYYMDVAHDVRSEAAEYVDIGEVYELKRKMLAAHESQLVWLRDHDGVDVMARMEARDRALGQQCGVEFAERFVPRGFRVSERLLP
ncbi:PIG-L family deacetylase [Chloroflexi bacterium TSY]|nr:PIG-L family deacetylase [Chloroflexi bacterium TSY]